MPKNAVGFQINPEIFCFKLTQQGPKERQIKQGFSAGKTDERVRAFLFFKPSNFLHDFIQHHELPRLVEFVTVFAMDMAFFKPNEQMALSQADSLPLQGRKYF
jgi:hypothetical protein